MLIAGNWKMNKDLDDALVLASGVADSVEDDPNVDAAVCPPFVSLQAVAEVLEDTPVALGAQTMHHENRGAYTGSISAPMLRSVECTYVIVGHSERRAYFCETDQDVHRQVASALSHGLVPIVCVGESLDQRREGKAKEVVETQVTAALEGIPLERPDEFVIAYEPIWAIGTGETATPDQAQEMHAHVRALLAEFLPADVEPTTEILYGGSMKPHNAHDLLARPDITGGLVGGASLQATDFAAIFEEARKVAA